MKNAQTHTSGLWRRLLLGLLAPLYSAFVSAAPALQHGPFEIVMNTRRIGAGGFPNTSANPFNSTKASFFEVRLAGKRVELPGRGDSFATVLRVEGAPQPALLVNVGPWHLLTLSDGQLKVQVLGSDTGGLQWLDEKRGQPGPLQQFGPAQKQLESDTLLRGGKLLLIDRRFVLDVSTLTVKAVEPWIIGGLNASTTNAVARSPRGTLFAMPASGPVGERRDAQGVLLIDLARGGTTALPLGADMPLRDGLEPEAEWFERHYEWTTEAGGRERLRLRAQPLPWKKRGAMVRFGEEHNYRVRRVKPEIALALGTLMQQRFAAQPQADVDSRLGTGHYLLPACQSRLLLRVDAEGLVLYAVKPAEPPWVRCQGEILQIAAAFDADLAAGRFDRMLLP
jgi:hypothetical protein